MVFHCIPNDERGGSGDCIVAMVPGEADELFCSRLHNGLPDCDHCSGSDVDNGLLLTCSLSPSTESTADSAGLAEEALSSSVERMSLSARRSHFSRVRAERRCKPTLRIPCHGELELNAQRSGEVESGGVLPIKQHTEDVLLNESAVVLNGGEHAPSTDASCAPAATLAITAISEAAATDCAASGAPHVCLPSPPLSAGAGKQKKRVVFADAAGMQLTSVRLMTEGRDTPPRLDPKLLSSLQAAANDGSNAESPQFSPQFAQPVSSYGTFMDRLARNSVSLESVAVITGQVTGTIKVRNIAFEKDVFVRYTLDGWLSFVDVSAYYVNPSDAAPDGCGGGGVYDTFAFSLLLTSQLPEKGLQFAVCFRCRAGTFWDNNDSRNYSVLWEPAHSCATCAR